MQNELAVRDCTVTFPKRLKNVRKREGISQQELAKCIGMSENSISLLECSKKVPRVTILAGLAVSLNVSSDFLLGLSNELQADIIKDRNSEEILPMRLKKLRQVNEITKKGLARELKISRPSLDSYEESGRNVTIDILEKMARYFNVSSDYLLGLSDTPKSRTPEETICKICEYTELTEAAASVIQALKDRSEGERIIFDWLISSGYLSKMASNLQNITRSSQKESKAKTDFDGKKSTTEAIKHSTIKYSAKLVKAFDTTESTRTEDEQFIIDLLVGLNTNKQK